MNMNRDRMKEDGNQSSGNNNEEEEKALQELWMKFHIIMEEVSHRLSSSSSSSSNNKDGSGISGEELWQGCNEVDELVGMMNQMWDILPMQSNQEYIDMIQHCQTKLSNFLQQIVIQTILQKDWDDGTSQGQGMVARWLQHYLQHFIDNNKKEQDKIKDATNEYQAYQRRVFRQRCKPCIAHVAQIRKMIQSTSSSNNTHNNYTSMGEWLYQQIQLYEQQEDDEDDDEDEETRRYRTQPHAHATMIIFAEASNLIHPLTLWYNGLLQSQETSLSSKTKMNEIVEQMCISTIHSLQEEVQNLATRVGDWFLQDYHIRTSSNTTTTNSGSLQGEADTNNNLAIMDQTLEEMSFLSQVVSRYSIFLESAFHRHHTKLKIDCPSLREFGQELGLQYSVMETKFSHENWIRAQDMAYPTKYMTDEEIYIPSLVEDAIYLCQRALERANSTLSEHAMWTVSNWVVELWTLTHDSEEVEHDQKQFFNNVYTALLHQIGCDVQLHQQQEQEQSNNNVNKKKEEPPVSGNSLISGRFASALLQALDQSTTSTSQQHQKQTTISSAPSSGNASTKKRSKRDIAQQIKLDKELCTMNGMYAASTACLSLANLLNSLLDDDEDDETTTKEQLKQKSSVSMVQLAKEQMESKSKEFYALLQQHIYTNVIPAWCGTIPQDLSIRPPLVALASMELAPSLLHLYYYLTAHQDYNIMDASTFQQRDNDQDCTIFQNIFLSSQLMQQRFKCQDEVVVVLLSEMARYVSHLFLATIIAQKKHFTTWGSFLLSKQVRTLEEMFCNTLVSRNSSNAGTGIIEEETTMMNTAIIWNQFQKLTQAVTILQLERPSDWLSFAPSNKDDDHLTTEEKRDIMRLRTDFSEDAILAVCGNDNNDTTTTTTTTNNNNNNNNEQQ